MNDILRRIERQAGVADLASILADRLEPADLHSLLLEVYRRRAERRTPAAVLSDFAANRFARPSAVDPSVALAWDQVALATLPPGFTAVELSPVCPLGTNSAIATVSQNKALATTRNLEVVSDGTNVLALECALRRRTLLRAELGAVGVVRLAASHRLLRTQAYANARLLPHFRLFHLCSAGRDRGGRGTEIELLAEHLAFYLRALAAFLGERVRLRVALTDLVSDPPRNLWRPGLVEPLRLVFPHVEFTFDQARTAARGYYCDLCFKVYGAPAGADFGELADGGLVDWTQKLLSDTKERLCISGIGSERVCALRLGVH